MKSIFLPAFILFVSASFTACKKEGFPVQSLSFESVTAKAGTVTGFAKDSRGNFLQGINITVEHTVWQGTYLYAATGSNGRYSITIPADPAGDWTAKAKYSKKAYGKTYLFDMAGNAAPFTHADSARRNFTWKLSGKKPTGGYYGAHVDLYQFGTDAQMNKITIVFTPIDSTLIDGSPVVSFERNVEDVAGTFMVKDVPIGKYSIRAKYPGKKLYLENRHDNNGPALKKTVVFSKHGYLAETEYNIEFWVSE